MKAEIISIGTELLLGEITDTNAAFLASQLPLLGVDLYFASVVGDNQGRLVETLRRVWERADLIITTGGLGPTQDDITREAIAELLGEELKVDPALVQTLKDFFARYKLEMPQSNIKQATLIDSAKTIPNPRGTAPGWWVERDGRIIVTMPGPPGEMQPMWERVVFPKLQQRVGRFVIASRVLKTFGLSEAKVDELVSPFLPSANPTLATYAKPDGIHLRITAKASGVEEAQKMISQREAEIRAILGDYIWGIDSDILEGIVGNLLAAKGLSLATMESCTGGLLASMITNVPGSSAYFRGGLVAYSNEAKIAFGVDAKSITKCGVVSPEVAEKMSTSARETLKAAIGVGITGVAGPDVIEGKPIGTIFIGIDDGKTRRSFSRNYPGHRLQVKQRAAVAALCELRKLLVNYP